MPHYKKMVGEKCYLSPVAPEDAEKWAAWEKHDLVLMDILAEELTS